MPQDLRANDLAAPDAITDLILRIFRANGRLLLAGDQLVAPLGLTSARWQVLGSIAASSQSQPVVGLARDMGVSRQAVQRIVNDLAREGMVTLHLNPRHKRAQLVLLTERGQTLFEEALKLQRPWVTGLADGLTKAHVQAACHTLERIVEHLDDQRRPARCDERTSALK